MNELHRFGYMTRVVGKASLLHPWRPRESLAGRPTMAALVSSEGAESSGRDDKNA